MRARQTEQALEQDGNARATKLLAQITFAVVAAAGAYFLGLYLVVAR